MSHRTAAFMGALCLLVPSSAWADEALPIAVISIQTEDVLDQAEALTLALKSNLRRTPGWALQEGDWALEVLTVSLGCSEPPDATCETKMADQVKADRILWGSLKKQSEATVVGEIHLWTRGKGSVATRVQYSGNLTESADESLVKIAENALRELTGGVPKGKVKLRVGTIDGQVFENGQPIGTISGGQGTVDLPAGKHTLIIRGDGTSDLETLVEVKALGTVEVSLTPRSPEGGPDWQKIFGFSAIGLGLGFAAVGVVSSIRIQGLNDDLDNARTKVSVNGDVCEAAVGNPPGVGFDTVRVNEICSDADTFETLQMIMYPLAAVSVGTGIVLLATADWSGDPEQARPVLEIEPRVGLGRGDVRLTYSF